ncbi:MAG: extracellular solute-binding protein [bacterium]|nr:extracellular solute-binding protein [bacterium]
MHPSKVQIIIISVVLFIVLLLVLVFMGILPGLRSTGEDIVSGELLIWGVDNSSVISSSLIASYQALYPEVNISYQSFNPANYETQLINALAGGRGPDIFMVHSSWIPEHKDKMAFLDQTQYPLESLRNDFPDVVAKDFYQDGRTYALPLYIDTLTLFYNRDIFNNEGIVRAPSSWEELNQLIPRLVEKTESGRIVRAAIALGASRTNIPNAADILSLFMLQDEVQMTSQDKREARFASGGENSLRRYLSYANPANANYSWNEEMRNAEDVFASEDLAILIDYASKENSLKQKNPFINLGIASLPQYEDSQKATNYASYWGFAVANTSPNQSLAWGFIGNTVLNQEAMSSYSSLTNRAPALLSLIAQLSANPNKEFLARQILTADSWYIINKEFVDQSFSNMIRSVLNAQADPRTAISKSEAEIGQLLKENADAQN